MQNNKIELTKKENSIAYCLDVNNDEITSMFEAKTVSTETFKTYVRDIVVAINDKPLEKKSVATKRFLNALAKQRTKMGILDLIWNTKLAGDGEAVLK